MQVIPSPRNPQGVPYLPEKPLEKTPTRFTNDRDNSCFKSRLKY